MFSICFSTPQSKTIAEAFLAYIARIETEPDRSGHEDYDDGYAIKAGWNFFSGVGSRMYTNGAFKAIDLYLLLLWIFWKYGWAKKLSMKARYVYFMV